MVLAMLGEAQANLRDDQLNARKEAEKKGERLPPEYGILYEAHRAIVKCMKNSRVPILRTFALTHDKSFADTQLKGTLMSVIEEQNDQIDRLEARVLGLNEKMNDLMTDSFNGGSFKGGSFKTSTSQSLQGSNPSPRGSVETLARVERLLLKLEMHEKKAEESVPRRRQKASTGAGENISWMSSVKVITARQVGGESRKETRADTSCTTSDQTRPPGRPPGLVKPPGESPISVMRISDSPDMQISETGDSRTARVSPVAGSPVVLRRATVAGDASTTATATAAATAAAAAAAAVFTGPAGESRRHHGHGSREHVLGRSISCLTIKEHALNGKRPPNVVSQNQEVFSI